MVYRSHRQGAGISLGATLVAVFVLVIAAMTMSALGFHHTNFATRVVNAQHAQNLAESVVSRAIERLRVDRLHQEPVRIEGRDGSAAVVFRSQEARLLDMPRSTNNLDGGNSVEGDGGFSVPAESAHLVGRGTYRGVTREVEAIVSMPRFPYVIATSGALHTRGDLLVASIPPGTASTLSEAEMLPGDLVANGQGPDCVNLGKGALVTGNLRSSGGVKLTDGAVVRGEVQVHQAPVALPSLDLARFDPGTGAGVQHLTAGWIASPVFSGSLRCSGSTEVSGGLTLEGGVLYVDGDLTVQGGVTGTGALVVRGSLTIHGATDLSSDNQVALLCGGDAVLVGSGKERSFFRGLIYTQGNLSVENITLVGSLVANGPQGSRVDIVDASLLADSSLAEIALTQPASGTTDLYFRSGEDHVDFVGTAAPERPRSRDVKIQVAVEDGALTVTHPGKGKTRSGLTPKQALQAIEDLLETEGDDDDDDEGGLREGDLLDLLQQLSTPESATPESVSGSPGSSFDFNQFIAPAQRMRIVLWRLR